MVHKNSISKKQSFGSYQTPLVVWKHCQAFEGFIFGSGLRFRNIYLRKESQPAFTVQATVWRDKKLVGFLHNFKVEQPTGTHKVLRWSPTQGKRVEVEGPTVVSEYTAHYSGVDHKDRDTADWTVSIRGARFYMRIFFWLLDGVIHATDKCSGI